MNDKYLELAKKLKALAERGEGGEATKAQNQLDKLMRKYNISAESLESEVTDDYAIYGNNKTLLRQIVVKVCGSEANRFTYRYMRKKHIGVTTTQAKALEAQMMYEHYERLYKKEEDIFFYAFCNANGLLVPSDGDKELTEEELQAARRAMMMSQSIQRDSFRKSLTNHKTTKQ